MNNIEQSNSEAIRDSLKLVEKYPLQKCLARCHELCDALDNDDDFEALYKRKKTDDCLKEVYRLSIAKYGARNLLSALYYVAGDVERYLSNLEKYKTDLEDLKGFLNGW